MMKEVIQLAIIILLTITVILIVITDQLHIKYKNTNINNSDNKSEKKENIYKSVFLSKLFLISSIIWLILSFLIIGNPLDIFYILFFIIPVNVIFMLIWFNISMIITQHRMSKNKNISSLKNQSMIYEEKNISEFQKVRFPLIMSVITFIIGSLLTYTSIGMEPSKDLLIVILISYFPCILFLTITFFCHYFGNKRKVRVIFKAIAGVFACLLIYYYFIGLFMIVLIESTNPITNIKYYKKQVNGTELTKVFPKKIPDDVENIKFHYAPGALQAGTNYMLYYVDKNMTMEKFDNNYKEKAIWIGHKKEYNEKEGLLVGTFSYTPAEYKNEEDFIIYLVDGECDDSGYCNHGKFLLAAYNEKTNEVIFRAEYW